MDQAYPRLGWPAGEALPLLPQHWPGKTALAPYPDRGKLTGYQTSSGQRNPARRGWRGGKNYSAGPDMSPAGLEYATVRIMQGFLGILGMRAKCSTIEEVHDASDV